MTWQPSASFEAIRLRAQLNALIRDFFASRGVLDLETHILSQAGSLPAVHARGGEPVLFETAGSDLQCAKIDLPWMEGRIRPAITWQWAEGAVPYMAEKTGASAPRVATDYGWRSATPTTV